MDTVGTGAGTGVVTAAIESTFSGLKNSKEALSGITSVNIFVQRVDDSFGFGDDRSGEIAAG